MQEIEELLVVGQGLIEEKDLYMKKNIQMFEAIQSNYLEVNRLTKTLQEQAKKCLEALMEENRLMDEMNRGQEEIAEMDKQEQQLQQELKAVQQNQQKLSAHCEKLKEEKQDLEKEKERLGEEKDKLENETTVQLDKRREEIKLFTAISRIRWDFDSAPHDVVGYICNKTDVKPFNFDQRKCSQFFITNSLWDSMKEKDTSSTENVHEKEK